MLRSWCSHARCSGSLPQTFSSDFLFVVGLFGGGSTQWCSEFTPSSLRRPYRTLGIEPRWAICKASALPVNYLCELILDFLAHHSIQFSLCAFHTVPRSGVQCASTAVRGHRCSLTSHLWLVSTPVGRKWAGSWSPPENSRLALSTGFIISLGVEAL